MKNKLKGCWLSLEWNRGLDIIKIQQSNLKNEESILKMTLFICRPSYEVGKVPRDKKKKATDKTSLIVLIKFIDVSYSEVWVLIA